tara:strand:- start:1046 stop:1738 length:693 start_codon:yes stop_codon:yes gene_type:complete
MAYANGKFAIAICDYCGFQFPYKTLRKNWKGFMVCPEDYEPKEPQIEPLNYRGDAIALRDPRTDRVEPVVVFVGLPGDSAFNSIGSANYTSGTTNMQPFPTQRPVEGVGSVGTVTIILPTVTTLTVTVANPGSGNKYYVDGVQQPTLTLNEGSTYKFDQSAGTNGGHPLRFSTTSDGTHSGGTEYTTGVTTDGVPGNTGAYTQIVVATGAPTLYYYCTNHSGMGGQANTP